MDDEEEKLFLDRLTLKVWKARREGSVVGAAYVLGIGFLLYLIVDVGVLDPVSGRNAELPKLSVESSNDATQSNRSSGT